MGTGYTRNDSANNIADGNVINASDLDGEFDAVQAAFNGTTGHSHDGTTGEGPQIATGGLADNAVTTAKITDANVTLAKMAANSVDSDQYVDGSIDTAHIGNLQVTTALIAADAIDGTKLADNAVDSEHYTDGSIDRVHLAADIVDGTKIADDSIDSEHYVDGSIDTAHIANDAVTGDKLANNIQIAGTLGVTGETTLTTHLNMGDGDIIKLGAGSDLQIYHDGSNSYIAENGTGQLYIQATDLRFYNSASNVQYLQANDGAEVILYYNNSPKLATTNTGIDVTGVITTDGMTTSADINFGDNDKAVFGAGSDLQIYHTGTESIISDAGTGNLKIYGENLELQATSTGETYFNAIANGAVTLYHNNSAKLATKSDGVDITGELQSDSLDVDGNADISGQVNFHSNVVWDDNNKLIIGNGSDLQIYHNGEHSFIEDVGTGNLRIRGTNLHLQDSSGYDYIVMADAGTGGTVDLKWNASSRLTTKSDGVDITGELQCDSLDVDGNGNISGTLTMGGNVDLQDNDKLMIGSSDDLQIYHDGSNSIIKDNGTGNLYIDGSGSINFRSGDGAEYYAIFNDDGKVGLRYNNVEKLATTSTGVDITGDINDVGDIYVANKVIHAGDTDTFTQFHNGNEWRVVTGNTEMLEVNDSYILLGANSVGKVQTSTNVSGSITPNLHVYNSFIWTLTGNTTINNPTTEVTGMSGVFIFIHSGAGRTVSLGTDWETAGGAGLTLSGTSGAVDIVPYFVQSSGNILLGTPQLAFS